MVRCADCGFLAMRHSINRTLDEAEECVRQNGATPPLRFDQRAKSYEDDPLCFARQKDLRLQIGADSIPEKVRSVIQAEHTCAGFFEWTQGLSPKEHLEMRLLEEQRDYLQEQRQSDLQWRADESKRERTWRTQEGKDRRNGNIILIFALLAAIIIPLVAAIIERGPEQPMIIVQPSEALPPNINVQPPSIRLEPNIIINMPTPSIPGIPDAQPEVIP